MKQLAARPGLVIPGHDPGVMTKFPNPVACVEMSLDAAGKSAHATLSPGLSSVPAETSIGLAWVRHGVDTAASRDLFPNDARMSISNR